MMKSTRFSHEKEGAQWAFTQVELLVVVAMIALFGAIGLAASARLNNQTKIAQCSVNLRQLVLAQLMYAADNSDNLPPNTGGTYWPWDTSVPTARAMIQYGVATNRMYCPGTAPRFTDNENWAGTQSLWNYSGGVHLIGYALTLGAAALPATNRNLTVFPQPMTIGPWTVPPQPPSQRVLTADANLSYNGNFTSVQGGFAINGVLYDHICPHLDGAYPAGGNVGMLDGHVEWRAFKDMKRRNSGTVNGVSMPYFYW